MSLREEEKYKDEEDDDGSNIPSSEFNDRVINYEGEGEENYEDQDLENEEEEDEHEDDEEVSNVIPPEITLFDLKTTRLQHLFNKEFENFERAMTHFKKTNSEADYKNEIVITFWLAVNEEAYDYATYIYDLHDAEFLRKRCSSLVVKSIRKRVITENFIKSILKKSDSFAVDAPKPNNQSPHDNASAANDTPHDEAYKIIGGPAAVEAKKKHIPKSIKLSSFLKLNHHINKERSQSGKSYKDSTYGGINSSPGSKVNSKKTNNENRERYKKAMMRTSYYGK